MTIGPHHRQDHKIATGQPGSTQSKRTRLTSSNTFTSKSTMATNKATTHHQANKQKQHYCHKQTQQQATQPPQPQWQPAQPPQPQQQQQQPTKNHSQAQTTTTATLQTTKPDIHCP